MYSDVMFDSSNSDPSFPISKVAVGGVNNSPVYPTESYVEPGFYPDNNPTEVENEMNHLQRLSLELFTLSMKGEIDQDDRDYVAAKIKNTKRNIFRMLDETNDQVISEYEG